MDGDHPSLTLQCAMCTSALPTTGKPGPSFQIRVGFTGWYCPDTRLLPLNALATADPFHMDEVGISDKCPKTAFCQPEKCSWSYLGARPLSGSNLSNDAPGNHRIVGLLWVLPVL